jgi:signal transduction histidine kinase
MDLLKQLFGSRQQTKAASAEIDKIIHYTRSIVVRDDLIEGILQNYQQAQGLDNEKKLGKYIQIYFALEQFITSNKPLVIQRNVTKEQLRKEISSQFNMLDLPESFRVIFLHEKEQLIYLYKKYTQSLAGFIANQTGSNSVQKIISLVELQPNIIAPTCTSDNLLDFSFLVGNLKKVETSDLNTYFKRLALVLFKELENSFGTKTAIDITEKEYATVKELYDYDLISKYLTIAPEGILDRDRIAYMTREELEKQANAVVEERVHRELAEKATRDLQRAVDERTKELNAEKEALKKNDATLLASIRSVPVGLILTDSADGIVAINAVAKRIIKISTEVTKIAEISERMQSLDFQGNINACKFAKKPKVFDEFEFFDKILHITFTPIFLTNVADIYIGTVILLDDITEAKLLDRSKDEFFAIASHELRTPLTAIRGYLSLIESYYKKDITNEDVRRMLGHIDTSSKHLIEIVNEFLDMSRLEQGRIEFNFQVFSLSELLKEVINEVGALAENKKTFLKFENADAQRRDVLADRERTKQILANLIGNAIKFTDTGGVSLSMEEKEGFMFVRVTDSGKGIPLTNQNLLFKKFQQASSNPLTKDAQSGSGLGLYISKKLAQNMKGDVYLEFSEENKGSTFATKLPLAQ